MAREQRRREEAEATRRREEQERKAKEAREQRRHEQEVARLQLHKSGNGTETQSRKGVGKGATNMKEFAAAGRKVGKRLLSRACQAIRSLISNLTPTAGHCSCWRK